MNKREILKALAGAENETDRKELLEQIKFIRSKDLIEGMDEDELIVSMIFLQLLENDRERWEKYLCENEIDNGVNFALSNPIKHFFLWNEYVQKKDSKKTTYKDFVNSLSEEDKQLMESINPIERSKRKRIEALRIDKKCKLSKEDLELFIDFDFLKNIKRKSIKELENELAELEKK